MSCRSIIWLVCICVAAATATDDPDCITGTEPEVNVYRLTADNPDVVRSQNENLIIAGLVPSDPPAETSAPSAAAGDHSDDSQSRASGAPLTTSHLSPSADGSAGTCVCTPATGDTRTKRDAQPADDPSRAAAYDPPVDEASVNLLRGLSVEEKGRRLIQAATDGAVKDLRELLAACANVAAKDRERNSALHWAARMGHVGVARRLVGAGADVEAKDIQQYTPLHRAAQAGHAPVVRLLAASSADPNCRNQWLWTPLHEAAFHGFAEVANVLLEVGAGWGARTDVGATPLDIARERKHQQLVDILSKV